MELLDKQLKNDDILNEQVKEALWSNEERYRQLVEVSPDAIVVEIDDKIAFINQAGSELIGAENTKSVLNLPITNFIHTDSL
ncbi:MAG: PAS domain-containing protein, partial [Syntrophomonadaceae bacterium]|nr:PAS domain-containing protein [Syntrophomonadaceae bacterium]